MRVARQYIGSAGKITNCQIGVFAAYVSHHGHPLIDRALYFTKEWTDDPDRLEAAYVPADVDFATKPKLATRMIRPRDRPSLYHSSRRSRSKAIDGRSRTALKPLLNCSGEPEPKDRGCTIVGVGFLGN
jgi:DDE superfamily endonuclease